MLRRLSLILIVLVSLPALATASAPAASAPAASAPGALSAGDAQGDVIGAATADTQAAAVTTNTQASAATADSQAAAVIGGSEPGARTASAASSTASTIDRTVELRLTPDEPGQYDAVVTYEIPDAVTSLTVSFGEESTVTATNGFEQTSPTQLEWTESTQTPTFELTVEANVTASGRRNVTASGRRNVTASGRQDVSASDPFDERTRADSPLAAVPAANAAVDPIDRPATPRPHGQSASAAEGFVFVDPGPWALVRTPRLGTDWKWVGGDVGLEKSVEVAGEGATGGEIAYFGPVTRYDAMGENERVELVVPDRATLSESPSGILDSVTAASERLRVGDRSENVFLVAAPKSDLWGVGGIQYGADDAWAGADAELDTANNIWLHEYVHTRQGFQTTESGSWVTEATAEYYAALLTFEQGHITYQTFKDKLASGQRSQYDDDILALPNTWSGGANYDKGSLATGALDLRIRQVTDKRASFQTVFRDLNRRESSISNGVILDAVNDSAGTDTQSYASTLTESDTTAETWSESTHRDVFGSLPAVFEYRVGDDALSATGVFDTRELAGDELTLVTGETLTVDLVVANVGWETGAYDAQLTVDDAVVSAESGELAPNSSTDVTFTHTFDDPGTYTVTTGDTTLTVTVREPAEPTVESIDVPSTVTADEEFEITVTYRNTESVPGSLTVPFVVDDETLDDITLTVPAESSLDRRYTLTLPEPGEHTISVGDRSTTVTVAGDTASTDPGDRTDSPVPTPGFGTGSAILALLGAVVAGAGLARTSRNT